MAQKSHPTSLRLQKSNKHFASSWYSDYFHDSRHINDYALGLYMEDVSQQINHLQTFPYIQQYYRKMCILLFSCDSRAVREERENQLRVSRKRSQSESENTFSGSRSLSSMNTYMKSRPRLTSFLQSENTDRKFPLFKKRIEEDLSPKALFSFLAAQKKVGKEEESEKSILDLKVAKWRGVSLSLFREAVLKNSRLNSKSKKIENTDFIKPISTSILPTREEFLKAEIETDSIQTDGAASEKEKYARQKKEDVSLSFYSNTKDPEKGAAKESATETKELLLLPSFFSSNLSFLSLYYIAQNYISGIERACYKLSKYQLHEAMCRNVTNSFLDLAKIYTVRVVEDSQSALFLVQEIQDLLQKGCALRQIERQISLIYKESQEIEGIRLSFSGRVGGGRSKKAQKAKKQFVQMGQTSLHMFSSKLSFAQKNAQTVWGKIGIKIWICYK